MKYYVVLLVTYVNGEKDKVGIYTYDTLDAAKKGGYTYMGQYTDTENVSTVNVEVKNNVGGIHMNETWTRTTEDVVTD